MWDQIAVYGYEQRLAPYLICNKLIMKLPTRVQSELAAVHETKMDAYGDLPIVTSSTRIQAEKHSANLASSNRPQEIKLGINLWGF